VELDVDSVSSGVYHFEGVWAKAIHVSIAIRSPQIGEMSQYLVSCLWTGRHEVPEHVRILRKVQEISDRRICLQLTEKICRAIWLAMQLNNEANSQEKKKNRGKKSDKLSSRILG
jgi:hypothetical protein